MPFVQDLNDVVKAIANIVSVVNRLVVLGGGLIAASGPVFTVQGL
jgi:hypothetical protein